MPIRLTILLLGVIIVLLLIFSNPVVVDFNFLFWGARFQLYEVIIISILIGVFLTFIYQGHVKQFKDVISKKNRP